MTTDKPKPTWKSVWFGIKPPGWKQWTPSDQLDFLFEEQRRIGRVWEVVFVFLVFTVLLRIAVEMAT
jgi:hypothetical protein